MGQPKPPPKKQKKTPKKKTRKNPHIPAALFPHEHVDPAGAAFSAAARSQVQAPAGRARHEQRAPAMAFSLGAWAQLQFRAVCLPQLHLAWVAQMQVEGERPQQVVGTVIFGGSGYVWRWVFWVGGVGGWD